MAHSPKRQIDRDGESYRKTEPEETEKGIIYGKF